MALFLIFEVSIGITSLVKDGPIQIKKTIHKRSLDSMNYWQHEDVQIIQDDIQGKWKIMFHSFESLILTPENEFI